MPWSIPFELLPPDILHEIASYIDPKNGTEILDFALTSKYIYTYISPFLYHDIEVRGLHRATALIEHLLLRPGRAHLVHSLVLRPNYLRKTSQKRLAGERELALVLKRLAPNLSQMRKFVWDGLEVPESDVWATLRVGCPLLKEIGTNLGCEVLDPDSELFAFSDLNSFSLTTEIHGGYYHAADEETNRNVDKLPPALWTMLIDRCPNLQSLVLGDRGTTLCSDRRLDICPIVHARWSYLESLSLADARVPRDHHIQLFNAFIDEHRYGLKHLSYYQCNFDSYGGNDNSGSAGYDSDTNENENSSEDGDENEVDNEESITETQGGHVPRPRQRSKMALISHGNDIEIQLFTSVQCSLLQEFMLTTQDYHWGLLRGFHVMLRHMSNLKKFGVWLDFSREEMEDGEEGNLPKPILCDQMSELRKLYEDCPVGLESLTLLLSTKSKKTMRWHEIPLILRRNDTTGIPTANRCQLKHLEVWKVFKFTDGSLGNAALKIALDEDPEELNCSADHNFNLHSNPSTSIKLTAPLLESIVLVSCLDRWGPSFYERAHIIHRSSYRIRRRYTNVPTLLDDHKILNPKVHAVSRRSIPLSAMPLARSLERSKPIEFLPRAFDSLNPLLNSVRRLKSWVQNRNAPVVPEMVVTVKADQREGEHKTWSSEQYEIQMIPVSSSHQMMILDGRRVKFGSVQVVAGGCLKESMQSKHASTGRKWRAIQVNS